MTHDNVAPKIRVWRYLDATAALSTIEQSQMRVSRLHLLNDPFEGRLGISGTAPASMEIAAMVAEDTLMDQSKECGMMCFSAVPDEPVLWSHYADHHRGMALDFAISGPNPRGTVKMIYDDDRPCADVSRLEDHAYMKPIVMRLLEQKSKGWAYEKEYRLYVQLSGCTPRGGCYYQPFDADDFKRVLVGWRCPVDVPYVRSALDAAGFKDVPVSKAVFRNRHR